MVTGLSQAIILIWSAANRSRDNVNGIGNERLVDAFSLKTDKTMNI